MGVWPEVTSGSDINAVDRSSKGDILVTADDFSSIKLFRFPANFQKQGYNRYSGHAAHVSLVRFTADDEYLVSLGGADKSIFQWKFAFDKDT
jgi:WD40 repeat protein